MTEMLRKVSREDSLQLIKQLPNKPLELGWLAAIFDGEGTVNLAEDRRFGLSIPSTDLDTLEKVQALVGGTIYPVKVQEEHYKPTWRWYNDGHIAMALAQIILPLTHTRRTKDIRKCFSGRVDWELNFHEAERKRIQNGFSAAKYYLDNDINMTKAGAKYGFSRETVRNYIKFIHAGTTPEDMAPVTSDFTAPHHSGPIFPLRVQKIENQISAAETWARIDNLIKTPWFLGWAVGLLEGEGSVTMLGKTRLRLQVEMTDLDILLTLQTLAGGRICKPNKREEHHKQSWIWYIEGFHAAALGNAFLPHLSTRRTEEVSAAVTAYEAYAIPQEIQRQEKLAQITAAAEEYLLGGASSRTLGVKYGVCHTSVSSHARKIKAEREKLPS